MGLLFDSMYLQFIAGINFILKNDLVLFANNPQ